MMLSVEMDDVLYANFDVSSLWNYTQAVRTDFTDLPNKPADKIIAGIQNGNTLERIRSYLPTDLYAEICENNVVLIMNRFATKLNGIKAIARERGIGLENIIAFGDDYNDMELIKVVGRGVAVANALEEVKAVADYIAESNESDGVAKYRERIFFLCNG